MKPIVLPPTDRERALPALDRFLLSVYPGKPLRVKVEIARPDRTPAMNRYLWAVPYRMLSEVTGFTEEELHEWFCGDVFGWKDKRVPRTPTNPLGIASVPVRTTTRDENGEPDICSAEDFKRIWERAQQAGAKLGVFIPDPDPDYLTKRRRA